MVKKSSFSYPIILASASPRRQELMRRAGYEFDIVSAALPEPSLPDTPAVAAPSWAEALAYFKARAVSIANPNAIVIGADTVVAHSGNIIGKPRDKADARRILSNMFAGESRVITGLAVLIAALDKRIITHEITTLVMRPMCNSELEEYLAGGTWRGKAGAYAIQEGGDKFIQSINGSESNVVGLPMEKLSEVLSIFSGRGR